MSAILIFKTLFRFASFKTKTLFLLRLFLIRSTRISKVCLASPSNFGHLYDFKLIFYRIFGHHSVPIRDQSGSLGRNLEQPRHGHNGQFGPPICRLHEIFRRRCAPKDKWKTMARTAAKCMGNFPSFGRLFTPTDQPCANLAKRSLKVRFFKEVDY